MPQSQMPDEISFSPLYSWRAPAEVLYLRNKVGKTNGVSSQRRFPLHADKQKENEKLREALSRKAASLEHLQRELASVRAEKERLQREVDEKESQNQRLLQEVCHGRRALSR